jgi:flagellar hook-associated protein 3 FlgL
LDNSGKIVFEDKVNPSTPATLSLYDASSNDYSGTSGAALVFNANSALITRDPKTDFFSQIEQMIRSVEEGKKRADGSDTSDPRNIGVQNGILMMEDLLDHIGRVQTQAGSYSQLMQASSDRADLLIVNTKKLQSDVIDTDTAESTLRMQQLSLNYQALLSNISKVSKLSLVNYM